MLLALKTFGRWFGAKVGPKEVRTALGVGLIPWTVLFLDLFVSMAVVDPRLIVGQFSFLLCWFCLWIHYFTYRFDKTLKIGFLKTFLLFIFAYATTFFFPLLTLVRLYFGA